MDDQISRRKEDGWFLKRHPGPNKGYGDLTTCQELRSSYVVLTRNLLSILSQKLARRQDDNEDIEGS